MQSSRFLIATLAALVIIAASAASAARPTYPCVCANGGTRDTAVTSYCKCNCVGAWAKPDCSHKTTDRVSVAIVYRNTTVAGDLKTYFSLDRCEKLLVNHFSPPTPTADHIKWIRRLEMWENDKTEVTVQFLITGSYLANLFSSIYENTPTIAGPSGLTTFKMLAAWVMTKPISPASIMARHFAKGDVLGQHAVAGGYTLTIVTAHLEFFIAALVVLAGTLTIEGLLMKYAHPQEHQLDQERITYGEEQEVYDERMRRQSAFGGPTGADPHGSGIAGVGTGLGGAMTAAAAALDEDGDGDEDDAYSATYNTSPAGNTNPLSGQAAAAHSNNQMMSFADMNQPTQNTGHW